MMDDYGNKIEDIEDVRRRLYLAQALLDERIRCAKMLKDWADEWMQKRRESRPQMHRLSMEEMRGHLDRRNRVLAGIAELAKGRP